MFEKVLIANRGEIACRIIRTCRRLGIGTVAVYSEADADALHVRMADEAVLLGPAPASESYLRIDRIVDAARRAGAEAVHPGYGFLSENAAFAEALDAEGIGFVGPPAPAIRLMGDKLEAKRLALEAGVSTVPGHALPIRDSAEAARIAKEIGYPVMIKAAAGGGGKGMRIASRPDELREGLERARSEARSSFGDDRVFLEKYIAEPRHIEIQVLGDRHGLVIHLGERECSIQRRHQKVIEEAPSPLLDEATRAAMGTQAVALARAVGYHSAGTVEFIVDAKRNFYFLEMNTRLQVEHPVTELVTGLDLVEQMLRIAAGERLGLTQDHVRLDGWAIEARVYAEDPARGFLPSSGRLRRYVEPAGEGIRVDAGVVEGSDVALFYDPMIAKVCGHGADRPAAIAHLREALDGLYIRGPGHNVGFLSAVLRRPRFVEGRLSTDFIAAEFGERFEGTELDERTCADLAAAAVAMRLAEARRATAISGRMGDARIPTDWVVRLDERDVGLHAERDADAVAVVIDGRRLRVTHDWRPGLPLAHVAIDDRGEARTITLQVDRRSEGYWLSLGGSEVAALVRTRKAAELAARIPAKAPPDTSKFLLSPMPGLIISIPVRAGEPVKAGQELLVLEAMKMENVLRAERDAVVEAIEVEPGATVAADQVLIAFA
jgi:propionyl-CoA carboxylase alpha chain